MLSLEMLLEDIFPIVAFISIVMTVLAAWFSYSIYRMYGQITTGWYTICIALAVMVLFRLLTMSVNLENVPVVNLKLVLSLNFALVSGIFLYGFWQMQRTFLEHEFIEKETMDRIRFFEAGRKGADKIKPAGKKTHR